MPASDPEHLDGRRQRQDRRREDDRHNAGCVDLDRQVSRLTTVHLAAHNALCVLDRDAALSIRHVDDEYNHRQTDKDHKDADDCGSLEQLHECSCQRRTAGDNAREKDDRDTVADTVLGDVLAHPHNQRSTCGERHDDDDCSPDAGLGQQTPALKQHVVGEALNETEQNGNIARPACDLLLAFLTAVLNHMLEGRDGNGQQLQDNRCVDIGSDAHCENRRIGQAAAGEDIHEAQKRAVGSLLLKDLRQHGEIYERNRDRRTEAEDEDNEQSVQNLLTQFCDPPRILNGLEHLRSPRPFRLPSRSSPLRKQRMPQPLR